MNKKFLFYDAVAFVIGSMLYAVGVNLFLEPANITIGGATGIATTLNHFFGTPVGLMIILINVPLVLLAWKVLGFKFIIRSAIGLMGISVAIDLLPSIDLDISDPLLASLFGGAIMGVSLGILFMRGFSTGGSDYAVWMLKKKFPHLSAGVLLLIVDAAVILIAAAVEKDPQKLLYSVVTIFVSQKALDLVMSMGESAEMIYVISDKYKEVAECISTTVNRGVTILDGWGYYSGAEKKVILCAMSKAQFYPFLSKVKAIDPNAFIIMGNASRVIGAGFKNIEDSHN